MKSLIRWIYTTVYVFIWYFILILVGGSFEAGSFEIPLGWRDLLLGLIASMFVSHVTMDYFARNDNYRMLSPVRLVMLIPYAFVLFIEMAKANIDVATRVITGRINPGIVRIKPGLKTDLGVAMLANSITLTPGTLTVDVDPESNDLFIHWINVEKGVDPTKRIAGKFLKHIRRITE